MTREQVFMDQLQAMSSVDAARFVERIVALKLATMNGPRLTIHVEDLKAECSSMLVQHSTARHMVEHLANSIDSVEASIQVLSRELARRNPELDQVIGKEDAA